MTWPAAPGPRITPWLNTSPTRYQTSVAGSRSRIFSAKVFGGGTAVGVFAAFVFLGAARFLAAFFGLFFGAAVFFAVALVGTLFLLFFGLLEAAVRELGFFRFFAFFFLVAMYRALRTE